MIQRFVFGLLILGSFLLMANSSGRGRPSVAAPGDSSQTCGSFGCHSGSAFIPELTISMKDSDNNLITEYKPGQEYTVILETDYSGNPFGFGFQIVSLKDSDESGINNFSDFESGIDDFVNRTRQYVEHTRVLGNDSISIKWTAPEVGTGDVTFYGVINAVNGDDSTSGDGADTSTLSISEGTTSSSNTIDESQLEFSPNPTDGVINFSNNISEVLIRNMEGKILKKSYNTKQVNVTDLESGMYLIESIEGKARSMDRFIKL